MVEAERGNEHSANGAPRGASWVVVCRESGKPVVELFTERARDAINTERYRVVPILAWLQEFNRAVREGRA